MTLINTNNLPAEFKDPFRPDKVKMIAMYYHIGLFDNKASWSGKVEFKNGDTKGEQSFSDCETLEELAYKVKNFIGSL